MSHVQCQKVISAPRSEVFRLLTDPAEAVAQLNSIFHVTWQNPGIPVKVQSEFLFMMRRFGVEQPVRIRVDKLVTGNSISYSQVEGFFSSWNHTIRFEDHGQNETLVTDLVDYEMPFGLFGRVIDDFWWRSDLLKILESRLAFVEKQLNQAS